MDKNNQYSAPQSAPPSQGYGGQPGGNDMYQASDGKWYPRSAMPQDWQPNQGNSYYGQQPMGYGGQQPQYAYGSQPYGQPMGGRPVYVQGQQRGGDAGMGCLAATCGALLCFNLGACLF